MKTCAHGSLSKISSRLAMVFMFPLLLVFAGCGGAHFSSTPTAATPTVSIAASPASITAGSSSMLTVAATNATAVTVTGSDGTSYSLSATGGTQAVTPGATTTYTANASGTGGKSSSTAAVTVSPAAPAPAPTVTLAANPTSITAGSSSTLTVVATNATAVTVTGSDGSSYKLQSSGGTQAVSPTATTTYTANATGAGGKASAVTTVTVTPTAPAGMPAVAIAANPTSITAGGSSTLTVTATNATAVTVTGSDGTSYNLSASGGTQVVHPAATTTYTAKATGSGGDASATAVVTVATPSMPTVTIAANPTSITAGGSSTLTVTATNALQVTVTGSDGSSYNLPTSGGTQVVKPTATTTYTANAKGSGGNASAVTTVTVVSGPPPAAPTVTIVANPTTINVGSASTLTVAATNATSVTVSGSDGSSYNLSATGGTQAVSPAATTTYTATATGAGGNASAVTTVTVVPAGPPPAAPTVTIAANPASINAGSASTLTVTAANATSVKVTGSDGSSYTLSATGGTQAVSPTVTTTYTATAIGAGGNASAVTTVTVVSAPPVPTVTIAASPTSIPAGSSSTLTVSATNATTVVVTGSDGSSYTLSASGGTQAVSPASTTSYTAEADGTGGKASASATVTVTAAANVQSINHVIFMLQENHTFDNYFGMLNPYRVANGWNVGDDGKTYTVDGIDDKLSKSNEDDEGTSLKLFKLASTCIDDDSSDWLASYGSVNRYDFLTSRPIKMDGFVHTAEGFAKDCASTGSCSGNFTDLHGERAMGYYDQGFLNYYYYMASQFAVSNRWFSPVASKSVPNRIATFTGGTTQGLVLDPGGNDNLPQLAIPTIFNELDKANVSWKVYYTDTQGYCLEDDDCGTSGNDRYPATAFSNLTYSFNYLKGNSSKKVSGCTGNLQASSVVGDSTNSFCIDTSKIAPLSQYYSDLSNGTLPSFAFIETGYGANDEHPGSGNSVLVGQAEVAQVMNAFMASPEWNDSVFFFAYDEGGGPYDHVPPVPGHSNDNTDASLGSIPDISTIAVNPDSYKPCVPAGGVPTTHCDLHGDYPGVDPGDAPAVEGFSAQIGFRLPNMVISPFTRRHYVSNIPMDHTAILKFVESRFISSSTHLTARDAAQPNLLDFFDFNGVPWATPPSPPSPVTSQSLGYNPCNAGSLGP
jgi:phospholipase C